MSIKLKLNTNIKSRDGSHASGTPTTGTPKIKIKAPGIKVKALTPQSAAAPKIKVKPQREYGLGYDSEAEDREAEPAIEEEFVLRMKPGPDCDYLRDAIEQRRIGTDADIWFKFKDSRRAVVAVRGHLYAAKLVDLPCVIESNKTLDRKSIFKAADICQMLLVGDRIENEEAMALGPIRQSDFTFPHGLTAPLRNVRKRRFRKRVSHQTIEVVENEVNRLLELDKAAESTSFEVLDNIAMAREGSGYSDNESRFDILGGNAYGQSYENDERGDEFDEDFLAGQIEQSMMEVDEEHRRIIENMLGHERSATGTQSEESASEDEEDEVSGEELGEAAQESIQEITKLREDVADLNNSIAHMEENAKSSLNPIIRMRILGQKQKLEAERDLKTEQLEEMKESESRDD